MVKKYDIVLTTEAALDLEEKKRYIYSQTFNPTIGEAWQTKMVLTLATLTYLPCRKKIFINTIYFFVAHNHWVFYEVIDDKNTVRILRIISCSRDLFAVL